MYDSDYTLVMSLIVTRKRRRKLDCGLSDFPGVVCCSQDLQADIERARTTPQQSRTTKTTVDQT